MNTTQPGKVLRLIDGITTLVPCTILGRDGRMVRVQLQDGTEVRTCPDYVLAD